MLRDCRPIGTGEIIEGVCAGIVGLALLLEGEAAGDGASVELSAAGTADGMLVSSSVMAILNVPSTMTTTLAPTNRERIFDVSVDAALA